MGYNPLTKEEKREARYFWRSSKTRAVFDMVTKGEPIDKIQKELKLQDYTLNRILNNRYFNSRLKMYLTARLEDYQIKKIQDLSEAYLKLKEEFFKRIAKATDDTIVREFIKLLTAQVPKLEKTDILALIMNAPGREMGKRKANILYEDEVKRLKESFGYEGELPISEDEKQSGDNQMDSRFESENEQGDQD